MGQIIIPTDKKVKGPWFIDTKALEELNETLLIIENKLEEAYKIIIDKAAESKLEEYQRWDKGMDIEKAKQKLRESSTFEKSDKYVLIITQQGKKIKEENLLSLLKGSQIHEFNPIELRIQIEKGPCEFTLEISTAYDGELETRIKALDDIIFNDINYEINKWIDKHKPNLVMQKWSSWFPSLGILFFFVLIITMPLKNKADAYKNKLSEESSLLLKDGLTEEETTKAIEIILQIESGYVPEAFDSNVTVSNTWTNVWLFAFISLLVLLIKPKTVIGLGKNKWKVGFYRKWTYFVLVFIPLSILLPIIRGKLF
jgi:hypothetical protein